VAPDDAASVCDGGSISPPLVRDQLARILRSRAFSHAPMLGRLLQHLVDCAVEGRTDRLKEYSIGVDVFDRGSSFDPRTDTIVRVQARRLRARLQDYYRLEGGEDQVVLELPKGRYAVHWNVRPSVPSNAAGARNVTADLADGAGPAVPPAPTAAGASIVVLPFANLSDEADNDYFSDGLTEEIISGLAAVQDLRVVARTSAFQFKGRSGDIRKIGRELGVGAAVEGSVRKDGRTVRVAVQLIDVADGFHLWSQVFQHELTGVFRIQEEIRRAVVNALKLRLAPVPRRTDTTVPEAYDWYLKGRYFFHKVTLAGIKKSVDCMQASIAADSGYAAAHAGLADAYLMWMTLAAEDPPRTLLPKARRAAETALDLDDGSAEAHCAMGAVLAIGDWNFWAAEREFRQALGMKPSFVHARFFYAIGCLWPQRRYDETIDELREALAADSMSVFLRTMLGQVLIYADRTDVAIGELRQALDLEAEYLFARFTLALAYLAKSSYGEALAILVRLPSETEEAVNFAGHLGYAHARLGNRGEAGRMLEQLLNRSWVPAVDVAAIYNGLGDSEQAIAWLDRARRERYWDSLFVAEDPRFRNLLSDPRLAAVLSSTEPAAP
jgi:serine/threonine-protein kinase